jgi:hypothetical protein
MDPEVGTREPEIVIRDDLGTSSGGGGGATKSVGKAFKAFKGNFKFARGKAREYWAEAFVFVPLSPAHIKG